MAQRARGTRAVAAEALLGAARCAGAAVDAGAGAGEGRRARHGVRGRHQRPGAPQGGGRREKGGDGARRDQREALGRFRGGCGTKAVAVADARGRARFRAGAGAGARGAAGARIAGQPARASPRVVGDRGLSSIAPLGRLWSWAPPRDPAQAQRGAAALPRPHLCQPQPCGAPPVALGRMAGGGDPSRENGRVVPGVLCLAASMDWLGS